MGNQFLQRGKGSRVWGGVLLCWVFFMLAARKISHHSKFHLCADMRNILGVPDTLNVNTNFPFLIVGVLGFVLCVHGNLLVISLKGEIWGWAVFYAGIASVAFGSAYYHLKPDDDRLVWDTLPKTLRVNSLEYKWALIGAFDFSHVSHLAHPDAFVQKFQVSRYRIIRRALCGMFMHFLTSLLVNWDIKQSTISTKGITTRTPPTKPQLYRLYRPLPPHLRVSHRRSGRRCCCICCIWSTLLIIFLILLTAIAGAVFYVIYSPRRPTFTLSSLKLSRFNLTEDSNSNSILYTKFNLTLLAKNRNHKLVYLYDQLSIEVHSSGVALGNGTSPAFIHEVNDATVIRSAITSDARELDADDVNTLRSDLKRKNGLPLKVLLETKVSVILGNMKSTKIGLGVTCHGITCPVPEEYGDLEGEKDGETYVTLPPLKGSVA
ncbi:hypothetical protein RJ641_005868 [Dillenia turbinata]|uniref:Late embryogenesis abundant protein LEA-2 subgroup domain-containing protein n=1 Tax=Dillenia turbinata TaxID=194707 RepID=A0AAN8VDG8_9MAGN